MTVTVAVEPKPILILDLTTEEVGRIAEAQRQGVDPPALLKGVIARLPNGQTGHTVAAAAAGAPASEGLHPGMTFAELLAPLRDDFAATGMSDEELGDFVDDVVRRVRAERRERENSAEGVERIEPPLPDGQSLIILGQPDE